MRRIRKSAARFESVTGRRGHPARGFAWLVLGAEATRRTRILSDEIIKNCRDHAAAEETPLSRVRALR